MTATIYRLDDYRRPPADPLTVACPHCLAPPRKRCVNRGTRAIRLRGLHPERNAAAEVALIEGSENT